MNRNYVLGVANGTLGAVGLQFVQVHLILTAYVYQLTGSNLLVGLLATLSEVGLFWPQLYVSSRMEHKDRSKPFYIFGSVLRVVALLAMAAVMYLSGGRAYGVMLALFFFFFFVVWSGHGCSVPAFLDMVGQAVPARRLGSFFAQRNFSGDTLSLLCGFFVVQEILNRVSFPTNYAVLAVIGTVVFSVGSIMFSLISEEPNANPPAQRGLGQTLRESAALLKEDGNYTRLLYFRILTRVNMLALAFYVPYGIERLGAVGMGGVLVGVISASRLGSSLLWGRLSNRRGNRMCLKGAGLFFFLSPLLALAAPHLPEVFRLRIYSVRSEFDLPLCVYLVALAFHGLAVSANMVGINSILIETAPEGRRPSYIGFLNTVTAPLAVLPLVAGVFVHYAGVDLGTVFVVAALSGALTWVVAHQIREPREMAVSTG